MLRRVVLLADESAHWKIAGLRQLERLARALNQAAAKRLETIELFILWRPDLPGEQRLSPRMDRLTRIHIAPVPPGSADLLLSTRVFLLRSFSIAGWLSEPVNLDRGFDQLAAETRDSVVPNEAVYLRSPADIPGCERRFLHESGKPQDGLVSRFINRPLSRVVSRGLLQTAMTPSAWTLLIFILPLVGAGFLLHGDYASVVVGLLFFQLYSVLDGCDGEIARAKYLESACGRQLDTGCDVVANLLLAVTLGYGLLRPWEGIGVAILIATNELILGLPSTESNQAPTAQISGAVYARHQQMVEQSGLLLFGPRIAWWMIQLTKRDVAILVFLLLALVRQPAWILHLSGAVAAISSFLALRSRRR